MSKYLFLFTITPVQSFVAQARKTQDLYAGSFLLSHLCRIAANKGKNNWDIIFPDISNDSIPNRFVAIIEAEENKLSEIGNSLQQAVENELKSIVNSIFKILKITKPRGFDVQVQTYFTINWLFVPYEENKYKECYLELESLMGSIKSVRSFQQYPDLERGRKCSICGERNVKFYRLTEKEKADYVKERKLFSEEVCIFDNDYKVLEPRYLQAGEGLCAVCFIKRCLDKSGLQNYNGSFPSTSKIALFEAFKQLRERQSDLISIIDSDEYEPQGIFTLKAKNNLDDFHEGLSEDERRNTILLYEALERNKIAYSPYYAVMLFDGDSMGEWLSGSRIKEGLLKEFHKALTTQLGEFAKTVRDIIKDPLERDIIKDPLGVIVYAGGEDFLGFLNLNHLLQGMKTLREKFDELVNMKLKKFYKNNKDNMTFSAGVVIAHIKTPLSEVLNWARKTEHMAKEIDDNKDAFAIAVLKHSGEIEKTILKWKIDGEFVTDIMSKLITEFNADRLSNTFIKKLNQELNRLLDSDGNYTEDDITKTEIKRLFQRSCLRGKGESEDDFEKRKNDLIKYLNSILINSRNVRNFLDFLNVIDFIARQTRGDDI